MSLVIVLPYKPCMQLVSDTHFIGTHYFSNPGGKSAGYCVADRENSWGSDGDKIDTHWLGFQAADIARMQTQSHSVFSGSLAQALASKVRVGLTSDVEMRIGYDKSLVFWPDVLGGIDPVQGAQADIMQERWTSQMIELKGSAGECSILISIPS